MYYLVCIISKALHLDEINRKEAHLVPHMENHIKLADKITVWISLEKQTAFFILIHIQVSFAVTLTGEVIHDIVIKHGHNILVLLFSLLWLEQVLDYLIESRVTSLWIDLAKLSEAHIREIIGLRLL